MLPKRGRTDVIETLSPEDAIMMATSGDILLLSGRAGMSRMVEFFCSAEFSHIGIIYRQNLESEPMVFESVRHGDDTTDAMRAAGVRMVPLRSILSTFKGHAVAIRTLCFSKDMEPYRMHLRQHINKTLTSVHNELRNRKYKERYIDFFTSRFKLFGVVNDDMSTVFCSELVAYCYMKIGVIQSCLRTPCICPSSVSHTIPCDYLPDDFSSQGKLQLIVPQDIVSACPYFNDYDSLITLSKEQYIALPHHGNETHYYHIKKTERVKYLLALVGILFVHFICIYALLVDSSSI